MPPIPTLEKPTTTDRPVERERGDGGPTSHRFLARLSLGSDPGLCLPGGRRQSVEPLGVTEDPATEQARVGSLRRRGRIGLLLGVLFGLLAIGLGPSLPGLVWSGTQRIERRQERIRAAFGQATAYEIVDSRWDAWPPGWTCDASVGDGLRVTVHLSPWASEEITER